MTSINVNLGTVPETLLLPLWGRAELTRAENPKVLLCSHWWSVPGPSLEGGGGRFDGQLGHGGIGFSSRSMGFGRMLSTDTEDPGMSPRPASASRMRGPARIAPCVAWTTRLVVHACALALPWLLPSCESSGSNAPPRAVVALETATSRGGAEATSGTASAASARPVSKADAQAWIARYQAGQEVIRTEDPTVVFVAPDRQASCTPLPDTRPEGFEGYHFASDQELRQEPWHGFARNECHFEWGALHLDEPTK